MTPRHQHIASTSPDDTQDVAQALAPLLTPGDVLLLEGPIGAGKSHFARSAILALLDVPEDVPSPTYTLVQSYQTHSAEIWHADLYRLSDPSEIHELGLWAAFDDAICFVEWPDRLGSDRPTAALTLRFDPDDGDEARCLVFSWSDPQWDARLQEVLNGRQIIA